MNAPTMPSLPKQLRGRLLDPHAFPLPRGCSPAMSYGRHHGPSRPDTRAAAVLILVYPQADRWWIPLTVRQSHLSAHAGQISLPGGSVDAGESTCDAARREFAEELGVEVPKTHILGRLTNLFVFNSNFLITPWVAWSPARPVLQPSEAEVAEVIKTPLDELLSPNQNEPLTIRRGRLGFTASALACGEHRIWGATRVILADLAQRIRDLDLRID